jgi:hypothetical protein
MKDSDIVQVAYEETVKKLFSVFYDSYVAASTQQEKEQAELRFKTAVKSARDCRDRALANL